MKNNTSHQLTIFGFSSQFPSFDVHCEICNSSTDLKNVLSRLPGEKISMFRVCCGCCRRNPKILIKYSNNNP